MSTTTRITALENRFDSLEAKLDRMLAALEPAQPAKVTRPKAEPKARRAAKPQVSEPKARCLTRKNRAEFVKAHPWAKGLSTLVIAAMAVEDPSLLSAGWRIGEGRKAMLGA